MKHKNLFPLILVLSLALFFVNMSFGQKGMWLSEKKLVEKYKLANAKFLKGKEYFFKSKNDKAEVELKKCMEMMPEHADALFFLSQISHQKGEYEQALAHIEQAEKNYEFISQFYTFIGQQRLDFLRDEKMRLEDEVRLIQDNLSRAGTDDEKRKLQSDLSSARGKLSTVTTSLNEQFLPSVMEIPAEYFYCHGNILFKLNRFQEAHDQYLKAITIDPKHPKAYNNLINLYYMSKNYSLALEYIEKAESNGVTINTELKKAVLKALEK